VSRCWRAAKIDPAAAVDDELTVEDDVPELVRDRRDDLREVPGQRPLLPELQPARSAAADTDPPGDRRA
jgi:hypothetical protein